MELSELAAKETSAIVERLEREPRALRDGAHGGVVEVRRGRGPGELAIAHLADEGLQLGGGGEIGHGAAGGGCFHRRCVQRYWSGALRTTASRLAQIPRLKVGSWGLMLLM